ncbi:hypothetical protein AMELA_G00266300, partial [Ameiurus melas]
THTRAHTHTHTHTRRERTAASQENSQKNRKEFKHREEQRRRCFTRTAMGRKTPLSPSYCVSDRFHSTVLPCLLCFLGILNQNMESGVECSSDIWQP